MLAPTRPDRALRWLGTLHRWGPTPAAAYAGAAIRYPAADGARRRARRADVQRGARRTNALAHELRAAGVGEQDGVAIMCRNHRGFIEATIACAKLGASALYLNTAFAGPADRRRARARGAVAVIYDEEFSELVSAAQPAGNVSRLARAGRGRAAGGAQASGRAAAR